MTTLFRAAALAMSLALLGCKPHIPPLSPPPPHAGRNGLSPDSTYGGFIMSKRVADKRPPTTLVSTDAFTCTVPESTWNATKLGDAVRCLWMWSH